MLEAYRIRSLAQSAARNRHTGASAACAWSRAISIPRNGSSTVPSNWQRSRGPSPQLGCLSLPGPPPSGARPLGGSHVRSPHGGPPGARLALVRAAGRCEPHRRRRLARSGLLGLDRRRQSSVSANGRPVADPRNIRSRGREPCEQPALLIQGRIAAAEAMPTSYWPAVTRSQRAEVEAARLANTRRGTGGALGPRRALAQIESAAFSAPASDSDGLLARTQAELSPSDALIAFHLGDSASLDVGGRTESNSLSILCLARKEIQASG